MREQPYLSVVMTVYNGERFLAEALDSIFAQSFADFELIVVDDASYDRTAEILACYDDARLRVVTNERNEGPYAAANRGLKQARGALIARHDADDISHPFRFQKQVARMREQPALSLLGTGYHVIDAQGAILDTSILPEDNDVIQKQLERGNVLLHGTFMMRREMVEQVGRYQESFPVSQDYDLSLRLAEVGELGTLSEPLYLFRFHRSSISRNKRQLQLACRQLAWSQAVARRHGQPETTPPGDVLAAYPPEPERLLLDALGTSYLFYVAGQTSLAEEALAQARKLAASLPGKELDWSGWIVERAHVLADLRNDSTAGEAFLRWGLERVVPQRLEKNSREILGRFFAERAFRAYQEGVTRHILPNAWRAVRTHAAWLHDRGLWSISFQALRGTQESK